MHETRRAVLEALDDGPVSGPALADRLDVSRAAIWKHIERLRADGFDIESTPDGYRLASIPAYGGAALEYGLEAPFEVEFHEEIDSTNRRARELAEAGADDVVVVADTQSGGRGRLNRTWSSPPGGAYLSIISRPELPPAHAPIYTLATAVAVTRTAREIGVDARIKWPNDVLVVGDHEQPRKLAGILTEMEGEADRVSWIVVGVGINVNTSTEDLPPEGTSIARAAGTADRRTVVQEVLSRYDQLRTAPESVVSAWREHALTLGRRVRVETPSETIVGAAVDIEFPGILLVETESGTRRVAAGDCEHLRPAD